MKLELRIALIFSALFFITFLDFCFAEGLNDVFSTDKDAPVIVNGDKVEFMTELNKVVAEGNVEIVYGESVLTCDRITVFTNTKDVFAEGKAKLKSPDGIIEGKAIFYNFDKKTGKIDEADFKMDPYFCVAPQAEKLPTKFILYNADITTCNLDKPHYRMHCRRVEIIPNDKMRAKGVKVIIGNVPIMYLPFFVQDIQDKRHGFSFTPGQSKEWGTYLLSAYRFYLNDDLKGLLRYDWRENKGFGGGIDFELISDQYGSALFRYYQVNEHLRGRGEIEPFFKDATRYKTEYRHKWDITDHQQLVIEVSDYSDANFLKNYFYREYEKDSQPKSYILYSSSYPYATLSLLLQKRLNQFFTETEKIPEVKFETVSQEIMDNFLYFQNQSRVTGLTSRTAYTDADEDTVRFDTYNKLSITNKLGFIGVNPYIGIRNTFYSKDRGGSENLFRSVFYSGFSAVTKFYRMFDMNINSYGIEINKLRHIITPSLNYNYIHQPTLPSYRLTAFEDIDSIAKQNTVILSLENKLQTKRNGESVDFLNFITTSDYNFKLEGYGGRFQDINFDLEMSPNSWVKYESDASFDLRRRSFRDANFDLNFTLSEKGSIGTEYRYTAGTDDEELITLHFDYKLNPKWRVRGYHRFEFVTGEYQEQEYTLYRDLHCWDVEFTVNTKRKKGVTFWIAFKLKAFPDVGFEADKSHHQPKTR